MTRFITAAAILSLSTGAAFAAAHAPAPAIEGANQDVSAGTVAASMVVAPQNGWLVVHRTDAEMKPGADKHQARAPRRAKAPSPHSTLISVRQPHATLVSDVR